MDFSGSKQRLSATALAFGAGVLLIRGLWMLGDGALQKRALWVSILLVIELPVDTGCLLWSVRWFISKTRSDAGIALRLGVAAALLHALRVIIFVLGRVGPWIDFDVRPDYRTHLRDHWDRGWLFFSVIISVAGVIGVIWFLRRRARTRNDGE